MSKYDDYECDPEMTTFDKVRGAVVLVVLIGGALFFLIRKVFF